MDTLSDLKNLWQTERAQKLPDAAAISDVVGKYQKSKKRNVILLLVAAVLLVPAFAVIFYFTEEKTFSVLFGEILLMTGAILTVIIKIKKLRKIGIDENLPNTEFLDKMQENLLQKPKANRLQIIAMLCFSLGYAFYIFNYIKRDCAVFAAVFSGICIYSLLMYFVLRPFAIKKSREKTAKMLAKISEIRRDF